MTKPDEIVETLRDYQIDALLVAVGEIAREKGLGLHQATFLIKTGFIVHSDKEELESDSV